MSAPSMTSPPDARRSLSRRPVGPVSTAGMEAVARMASLTKREVSDLPACITAEISDSAECKVSWWSSNCKVGIGLWRFWGVNKLGARFVGGRVSQRSVVIREFDKEVGERGVGVEQRLAGGKSITLNTRCCHCGATVQRCPPRAARPTSENFYSLRFFPS